MQTKSRSYREIAANAPARLKEKLAELAMNEGIEGKKELLEGAALVIAINPANENERAASLRLLREIGTGSVEDTFHKLLRLGELSIRSVDAFLVLKSELIMRAIRPPPSSEPETVTRFISWAKLSEDQLLERAQSVITRNSVTDQDDLQKRFRGVFVELYKRDLLSVVEYASPTAPRSSGIFVRNFKVWERMEDEEIIERAQEIMRRENIPDLEAFGNRYRGINLELRKRGIADCISA